MLTLHPKTTEFKGQDIFAANYPSIVFGDMARYNKMLFPVGGLSPLVLSIYLRNRNLTVGRLALEYAQAASLAHILGVDAYAFELEGRGGKVLSNFSPTTLSAPQKILAHLQMVLEWKSAGITILGDTNILTGNKIVLTHLGAETHFVIYSASGIIAAPFFRLRRAYQTPVTTEIIASGAGATTFDVTLAHKGVCPSSLKITFTDGITTYTAAVRDNGDGILGVIPSLPLLSDEEDSTINYDTGAIHLVFSASYVPVGNITADYEYGSKDEAEYTVSWGVSG